MNHRKALLLGATGLVGSHLLRELVTAKKPDGKPEYFQILVLSRRKPAAIQTFAAPDQMRIKWIATDFESIEALHERDPTLFGAEDVYCALGTTIKKAGSQREFFKVDYGFPARVAALAARSGAKRFLLVSSVGADPKSSNFYLKTKGQLESDLKSRVGPGAGKLTEVHLFRPSFLVGDRAEARPLEKVATSISSGLRFLLQGPLKKYRPVLANQLASRMVSAALAAPPRAGVHLHEKLSG